MTTSCLLPACLLLVSATSISQDISRQEADSMLTALKKSKQEVNRIGLLMNLAQFQNLKPSVSETDYDSARVLIISFKQLKQLVWQSHFLLALSFVW